MQGPHQDAHLLTQVSPGLAVSSTRLETQVLENLECPQPSKTISPMKVSLDAFYVLFSYCELHQEEKSTKPPHPTPRTPGLKAQTHSSCTDAFQFITCCKNSLGLG